MTIIEAFDEARKKGKDRIKRKLPETSLGEYSVLSIGMREINEFLFACPQSDIRATNWEVEKEWHVINGVVAGPFNSTHHTYMTLSSFDENKVPDGAKIVITWEE